MTDRPNLLRRREFLLGAAVISLGCGRQAYRRALASRGRWRKIKIKPLD